MEENRRSVKNVIVDTRAQFRLALSFLFLLCGGVIVILYLFFTISNFLEQQSLVNPEVLAIVGELKMKILMVSTGGIIILGLLCTALWLLSSHRIFGPMVQIHQQIDRFIAGDYKQKVKLRQYDEFHATANRLNELGDKLNATLSQE